jgi:choline dehydrogenase
MLLIKDELAHGTNRRCGTDLVEDIRQRACSVFHPSGTCRMAIDATDHVVDPSASV